MNIDELVPINGRQQFARAVQYALEQAADLRLRELCLADPDFIDWPLAEPGVLAALNRWAGPKRQLLLVAHSFDAMALKKHARFVTWRRTWAHLLTCRAAPELTPGDVPSLLLGAPGASLQRLDTASSRGRWLTGEEEIRSWRDVIDAVLQRSEDAFPAHTLGL